MGIEICNLTKRYGKKTVLNNVSLSIPVGMYGLLGKNGAGKTTLMRILATLFSQDSGTIRMNGVEISDKKKIREMVGYLPQEFSVYPRMSVYAALDYLGILAQVPRDIRRKRIDRLLEQVHLEGEKYTRFGRLSGGMKRRFGIAQALLNDPAILIVDEPTAGLDPEERIRLYNLLSELSEKRVILLSTHIASDLESTCSRAAILDQGSLLFQGKISELEKRTEGKVFTAELEQEQLIGWKEKYKLISIQQRGAKFTCRFLSNTSPGENCFPCTPTVEDSYMYLLGNQKEGD